MGKFRVRFSASPKVSRETPMTLQSNQLGFLGEKVAVEYLKRNNYRILGRNFRYKKFGEIDIIAKKAESIVFIEVKTRMANNTGIYRPEDNITYFKQKQLIKLAKIYLLKHNLGYNPWQIDVIAIEVRDSIKSTEIRHIKQAIGDIA